MPRQTTLLRPVSVSGVGLHGGDAVRLTIRPVRANSGIVFRRTHGLRTGNGAESCVAAVRATLANVVDTRLATTLGKGDVRIATVEHLMAAFAGLGIDNALVDVTGNELPVMDGSSAPFVRLLQRAGSRCVSAERRYLAVRRVVEYKDGDAIARLLPYAGFRLDYTLQYDHPIFKGRPQRCVVDLSAGGFETELAWARTFGFLKDVAKLQAMGLALGGGLDNAVVLDDAGILNEDGLRAADEFARHKILDAVGDLYLCGYPMLAAFVGVRSGHSTNHGLLRKLLADPANYQLVTQLPDASPAALYEAAG